MAEFHAGAITYATEFGETGVAAPVCFKCKKAAWTRPDSTPNSLSRRVAYHRAGNLAMPKAQVP
jgi:hypothetical protein